MQNQLQDLLETAKKAINNAKDLSEIAHIRTQFLGKKGKLTELLKNVGRLDDTQRASIGQAANTIKQSLTALLTAHSEYLEQKALQNKLKENSLDVTLPGRLTSQTGALHPVRRTLDRIQYLFTSIGFDVMEGPEIEDDYHNFEALNISPHHPARAMHDTFYFDNGSLLRTHTSPVQIRALKSMPLPLHIITPGRVYRCDSDNTHTPMFHQTEGLVVNKSCTFTELKGILENFLSHFFERDLKFSFRPSYFPFTEPSAEVDIACMIRDGTGCRVCKQTGWLEVLGCGMVHPNVLKTCHIDPEIYTGFAFGMGVDRLAMLRYGIDDLRKLFENDLRFLKQF